MPARRRTKLTGPPLPGLEKHRQKWRWRTRFEGRRLTFTLRARDETEAIAEVLELRRNPAIYQLGAWQAEATAYIAVGKATRKLSERNGDNRLSALLAAGKALGVASPRQVTTPMVANWLAAEEKRLPGSTSPGTYLRHLRAFFKHLLLLGKVTYDPTTGITATARDKNLRDVFIPAEDLRILLDAARQKSDRDLEFILALGAECGMRRGEISSCRPEWFDLRAGSLTIPVIDGRFERKGKAGRKKSATLPISSTMREIIAHHGLPAPFVIVPDKEWGKNRYRFEFGKRLYLFLEKHGFGHVTIHDLRRSFGSNRVSAGVSIEKVANWMGIDPDTAWKHYARFLPVDAEIDRGTAAKPVEAVAPPAAPENPPAALDVKARLARIEELHQEGLITDEERAAKREEILAQL